MRRCSRIIVYLLDCQGASFLLLFRWLIQKRLWQFDGSVSNGHLWLYPTCQVGMNCPSHQRSPLILLVEIVERHKAEYSGENASSNVTLERKKTVTPIACFQSISFCGIAHSSVSFHMWSLCDMVLEVFYETLTWYDYNWTPWQDVRASESSCNQNTLLSRVNKVLCRCVKF